MEYVLAVMIPLLGTSLIMNFTTLHYVNSLEKRIDALAERGEGD